MFIEGKEAADIASYLGVSKNQLMHALRTRATDDWREAQVIRAIRRKEEAEDAIDAADNLFALRQAETKLKSAQWDLSRICRLIYGDDAPKEDTGQRVSITLNLGPVEPEEIQVNSLTIDQPKAA